MTDEQTQSDAEIEALTRRPAIIVALGFLLVFIAYAAWAAYQILVLDPLAAVPGATLDEIRAALDAAGESYVDPMLVATLLAGPVAWLSVVTITIRRPSPTIAVWLAGLVLLSVGFLAYWWASFGLGMSLADTYGISGGDYSPWARPLYAVSALAALLLIGWVAVSVARTRRKPVAQSD